MSKKSKRKYGSKSKKRRSTPTLSATQSYRPEAGNVATATTKREPSRRRKVQPKHHIPTEEELAAEYHYVLTDLKRIGILAMAMLVLLIVLALILV